MNLNTYLSQLAGLLSRAEATDQNGGRMTLEDGVARAGELILSASRKVMIIGNGGSAAIASHMQNDLCKAVGIRALVFNEPPLLTALANDHGYETAFERAVELWTEPGDVLIAISSSGQSENILRAARCAKTHGGLVLTFSGFKPDNPLRGLGQINFYIASEHYGQVEIAHMALTHFLSDCAMASRAKVRNAEN